MSLAQATDEEILHSLNEIKNDFYTGPKKPQSIELTVGDRTFFVIIRLINVGSKDCHLKDYKYPLLELYWWRPRPPREELHIAPVELETPEKKYKFVFDVTCFPHIAIFPIESELFKSQPWAEKFRLTTSGFGYAASLTWSEICDVLRYCDKMARLKAFW